MPIFGRTKMILHDDCFNFAAPDIAFKYKGPDPQLAYEKIRECFTTVFGVLESERVQEKDYIWNREGKKESFKVSWSIVKDLDKFSYLYYVVKMSGYSEETPDGKFGEVTVEIASFLRTEYVQDNVWERSIFYEMLRVFWHKVFYQEKTMEYLDLCKSIANKFKDELRAFFALNQKK